MSALFIWQGKAKGTFYTHLGHTSERTVSNCYVLDCPTAQFSLFDVLGRMQHSRVGGPVCQMYELCVSVLFCRRKGI